MGDDSKNTPPGNGFEDLAQEARVRDFRMKRMDAPYTDAELSRLREDLATYRTNRRDRTGKAISWEKLAEKMGTSGSVLNPWAFNKYPGDEQKIARLVDQYLADEVDRTQRLPVNEYQSIGNAKRGWAVILEGVSGNAIVAVIGPSGSGKSTLMRAFLATRKHVIAVTIDEHSGSKAGVTRKLCEAVLSACGRTQQSLPEKSYERWQIVLDFFRGNRNAVLLLDEVQKLDRQGLEVVRDLHDLSDEEGQRNTPVVLFGDERFYRLLKRARSDQASNISAQFARRIAPIFDFERDGVRDGGTDLYTEEDIMRVLQNDRLRLVGADGIRWIKALANTRGFGLLGFAMRVVRTAYSIAGRKPPLTIDHLVKALNMTVGRDVAVEIDQVSGGELLRATA